MVLIWGLFALGAVLGASIIIGTIWELITQPKSGHDL